MGPITELLAAYYVRWIVRRDMPEVMQIEQGSFKIPWTEEDFLRCLRHRNCIGMVVEKKGTKRLDPPVVGYMIYELHKSKLHVLNMAVCPKHRRMGVGSVMVDKLISKMSLRRRRVIDLHLRESNLDAQLFLKVHGFSATRLIRGFYEDTGEDGYLMEYVWEPSAEEVEQQKPSTDYD
jgi:ribosomal-protein-alanine N-acetyltransferase